MEFIQNTAKDIIERFGTDFRGIAFVFLNKKPAFYLQKALATQIGKPFYTAATYSIDEFVAANPGIAAANDFEQVITLFEVYNSLLAAENQTRVTLENFYKYAHILINDIDLIDRELKDAQHIFADLREQAALDAAFSGLDPEQAAVLGNFWQAYSDGYENSHKDVFLRMWTRMPVLYAEYHKALEAKGLTAPGMVYRRAAGDCSFCHGFKAICFIGFNELNAAERKLIGTLQSLHKAYCYFDEDIWFTEDAMQEAGLALRTNYAAGIKNFYTGGKDKIRLNRPEICLTDGVSAEGQVQAAAALLAEKELQGRSTAIVLTDEHMLIPLLQSLQSGPDAAEVNVTMAVPITVTAVYGMLDLWLEVQHHYIKEGSGQFKLTHLQSFVSAAINGYPEQKIDQIIASAIKEKLILVPPHWEKLDERARLFFKQAATALDALTLLGAYLQELYVLGSVQQLLNKLEAEMVKKALANLKRLQNSFGDYLANLEPAFVLLLIKNSVRTIKHLMLNDRTAGIQVLGISDTLVLDFESVIIIGAAEGLWPKAAHMQSFLPYNIRRAYKLPTPEHTEANQAYLFYRLMKWVKFIQLYYSSARDKFGKGEPTRYLAQLEFEAGMGVTKTNQTAPATLLRREPVIVKKEGKAWDKLQRLLGVNTPPAKRFSASMLTSYISCQLKFFFYYIADLKEPDPLPENIQANSIGTIVHNVMALLYAPFTGKKITKEDIAALKARVAVVAEQEFINEIFKGGAVPGSLTGVQKVILTVVKEMAYKILAHDEELAPLNIIALEQHFELPYKVTTSNGTATVVLKGIIDRVDKVNGLARIVDYKTGTVALKHKPMSEVADKQTDEVNKEYIQTMLYEYIYRTHYGIKEGLEPNVYLLHNLSETSFFGSTALTNCDPTSERDSFRWYLDDVLTELFDETKPFLPTTNEKNCQYCPFKPVCGKIA